MLRWKVPKQNVEATSWETEPVPHQVKSGATAPTSLLFSAVSAHATRCCLRPARRTLTMPPRQAKPPERTLPEQTLVLDNGAYSIKAGFSSPNPVLEDCHIIPNCIAKGTDSRNAPVVFVGDQLDACRDFGAMSFRRPVERGYIVNWDSQLDIWKQALFDDKAKLHVSESASRRRYRMHAEILSISVIPVPPISSSPSLPHVLQRSRHTLIRSSSRSASSLLHTAR